MKKDLIFAPALLVIGVLLCLLKVTGLTAHIIISVVGIAVLIAYTAATVKEWKLPAGEIAMRVLYGLALISGVVVNIVKTLTAVAIAHKICAILFVVALIVVFVHKLIVANKK